MDKSLTYTLVVNDASYGFASSLHAYQFAKALTQSGHKLMSVFFYQAGVLNASNLSVPANDEFDLTKAWQALAAKFDISLQVCVAASLRRGVLSQDEAITHQKDKYNLADGFEMAGLGALSQAMLMQDRVVQF